MVVIIISNPDFVDLIKPERICYNSARAIYMQQQNQNGAEKKYLKVKRNAAQQNTKSNERNWLKINIRLFSFFTMAVRLSKLPKRLTAFHLWMVYQLTRSVGQQRRT